MDTGAIIALLVVLAIIGIAVWYIWKHWTACTSGASSGILCKYVIHPMAKVWNWLF